VCGSEVVESLVALPSFAEGQEPATAAQTNFANLGDGP
jgi:hypothetical protein